MVITKDMTIGEVVMKYPESVEVLISEGIHCVGCGAAHFETIEEGLMGHGKTIEEINDIIECMNGSIEQVPFDGILNVTKKAIEKLKELLKQEKKENHVLRIKSENSQFGFDLEEKPTENDEVVEIDGLTFVIDKDSLENVKGAKIDFMYSINGSGFRINKK